MRQIKIKIMPPIGSAYEKWEILEFDEFILNYSPRLRMLLSLHKQFPPVHILNEELLSGGADQGMSGGCFWKPFKLSAEEYHELAEEMLTDPKYSLSYDESLENNKTLSQWCSSILSKYNVRKT